MTPEEHVALEHRLTKLESSVQDIETKIDKGAEVQGKLVDFMTKYEARWGALFFIGTALWAAIVVFKDEILKHFKS